MQHTMDTAAQNRSAIAPQTLKPQNQNPKLVQQESSCSPARVQFPGQPLAARISRIMEPVIDRVRAELRREGVKLWLKPYTPPQGSSLFDLGSTYASRLNADAGEVAKVLEELRQHALTKLQVKAASVATPQASGYAAPISGGDIVTLLGKVLGTCPTQHREVRLQVRCSQTGEEVRQQLCNELGLSTVKGWRADPASGVLRVLLLAGPPAPSKPAATAQPEAVS
eukprot:s4282_g3.t1